MKVIYLFNWSQIEYNITKLNCISELDIPYKQWLQSVSADVTVNVRHDSNIILRFNNE